MSKTGINESTRKITDRVVTLPKYSHWSRFIATWFSKLLLLLATVQFSACSRQPPAAAYQPLPGDPVVVGAEMDVIISRASEENPEVDGVAKVKGVFVIVKGWPTIGERVNVRITERRERSAIAEATGKPTGTESLPDYVERPRPVYQPAPGDPVFVGAEMDVTIINASTTNPDTDGVAKIKGLVVFVKGVPTIGERVNVRITERRERLAIAEPTGKPASAEPAPESVERPRPVYQPLPGDPIVVGAEMDVTIVDASAKNPETDGVAKVDGLVVIVKGVPTIGERVNIRITERRERVAFAEPTGKPASPEPQPETLERARPAYQPLPGDTAAHVVVGAEVDVTIVEASAKNPDSEGVARVNGLVVVVKGVPTIGVRVNVRITERRERMAFAEPTGKPAGAETVPATVIKPARPVYQPLPGDPVVVGAEMDVVITEASEKNPLTDGVAKVNGLVVFVKGATSIGERVNVRITGRLERVAFAEPTGRISGADRIDGY